MSFAMLRIRLYVASIKVCASRTTVPMVLSTKILQIYKIASGVVAALTTEIDAAIHVAIATTTLSNVLMA